MFIYLLLLFIDLYLLCTSLSLYIYIYIYIYIYDDSPAAPVGTLWSHPRAALSVRAPHPIVKNLFSFMIHPLGGVGAKLFFVFVDSILCLLSSVQYLYVYISISIY